MFFFLALSAAKTPMVGSKRFFARLNEAPYSLVLFTTRGCTECDKILKVMDLLYDKFAGKVSMLSVDVDVSADIKKNYSVNEIPSVGVFSGTKFLHFYKGNTGKEALMKYCENFFNVADVDHLNSVFEIFQYQNEKLPTNLIVADESLFEDAKNIAPLFPDILNIAFVNNQSIARAAGINGKAQIRRPLDNFVEDIDSIDEQIMQDYVKPMIELLETQDQFGISQTKHTLTVLLDERDPLQRYEIANLLNNVSHLYDGKLSYQYCDFYKCSFITTQLNIINFGNPLFILSTRTGLRPKVQLFTNPEPTKNDLEIWLNKQVLGIDEPIDRNNDGLPKMRAHEFMRIALDPKRDIVLFMASPSMPKYKECRETAKMLVEIFQNIRGIEVYEFNPRTELVPGLQMPKIDKPMYSIWPATQSPSGANFAANQPLPAIVDTIIQNAKTKIDPTYFKQIGEMIEQFMKSKRAK